MPPPTESTAPPAPTLRAEEAALARAQGAVFALDPTSEAQPPQTGVVLGSGLGAWAEGLSNARSIAYRNIPGLLPPSVAGHAGALWLGNCGGVRVACLQGRVHSYEGYPPDRVVFGVRLLARMGCRQVLLTNAAGGIREGLLPGDLMLISDHINLTGQTPLVGWRGSLSPFVDMSEAYCSDLRRLAADCADTAGTPLSEGVYAGLLGPSYETPAEIRMLATLGADAVGMSTVLECLALRALGVRVGAMSCITNQAAGLGPSTLDHSEVQEAAAQARPRFEQLLSAWVEGSTGVA